MSTDFTSFNLEGSNTVSSSLQIKQQHTDMKLFAPEHSLTSDRSKIQTWAIWILSRGSLCGTALAVQQKPSSVAHQGCSSLLRQ